MFSNASRSPLLGGDWSRLAASRYVLEFRLIFAFRPQMVSFRESDPAIQRCILKPDLNPPPWTSTDLYIFGVSCHQNAQEKGLS